MHQTRGCLTVIRVKKGADCYRVLPSLPLWSKSAPSSSRKARAAIKPANTDTMFGYVKIVVLSAILLISIEPIFRANVTSDNFRDWLMFTIAPCAI